jgi:outer membrane protein assembly factor BamA
VIRPRRLIAIIIVVMILIVAVAATVLHLPAVQEHLWSRAVASLESATGLRVEADEVRYRLVPATLRLEDVAAGFNGRTVASASRLEIRFRWRRIVGRPRSIDMVAVDGIEVDLSSLELPDRGPPDDGDEPINLWQELEIGELRLSGNRLLVAGEALGVDIRQLTIGGELRGGLATVRAAAGTLALDREGRRLGVGPLTLVAEADAAGVTIERLGIEGDVLEVEASGTAESAPRLSGSGVVEAAADLASVASWWDPELAGRLSAAGRLDVTATVSMAPGAGLRVEVDQRADPVYVAGVDLGGLHLEYEDGSGRGRVNLGDRGWLEAATRDGRVIELSASLDRFEVEPVLAMAPAVPIGPLPHGLTISGRLDGTVPVPLDPQRAAADGDILVAWPGGEVRVDGRGEGSSWRVRNLSFELPGADGGGAGTIDRDAVAAQLELDIGDPARFVAFIGRWLPDARALPVAGGPAFVRVQASGPTAAPLLELDARWTEARVDGLPVDEVRASVAGGRDGVDWTVHVVPAPEARIQARGRTELPSLKSAGRWNVDLPSIAAVASMTGVVPSGLAGGVAGGGRFAWSPEDWEFAGGVSGSELGAGAWSVDEAEARFRIGPDSASISRLELRRGDAVAVVEGSLDGLATEAALEGSVTVDSLDLAELDLPEAVTGRVSATARVGGTVIEPKLNGEVRWQPGADERLAGPLLLNLELENGVLEVYGSEWRTAAGPVHIRGTVPLGGVPRPPWLWPTAPEGPVRASLEGLDLRSGPVLEALDRGPFPGEAAGDVDVEVAWDLGEAGDQMVLVEVEDLAIRGEHMQLAAEETVRVRWSDGMLTVEPMSLRGPMNHLELGGTYDPQSDRLVAAADLSLDARMVDMLPLPVRASGPIRIQAGMDGPLGSLNATVMVDHTGGSIVMREPAVEITDLTLDFEVEDGSVWIQNGEAGVNRGRLLLGGGWDVSSGQGVVLELEDVKALVGTSIVTSWSGTVAIEPDPDHPALVVGELALDAGLWERPFDLREALFGSAALDSDQGDPVNDVALDLQVSGYGGVRVDNNLGRFDASWGILEVGGTVGRPRILGTIQLAPGGTVNLPGQAVTIRRATLDFTGNPETDPVMEIVPESLSLNLAGGGDEGTRLDTTQLAAETLAASAGSALGFENTTLQPAEIAFETQTDASSAFTAGKRLTRNVALFLTTDLSDVQSQTTMLQLWNLRGLPGLAIQGYTRTGEDEQGGNLIERYRWGGSVPADDRPVIQKLRLEGEWPVSKRTLRRATGLRKGEPYEPFLLFAAGLRLETTLAERGYPLARVTAAAEGDPALPALVFRVDPGPSQEFNFTGDRLPKHVRRTAVGLYREPPLEEGSLRDMRRLVLRHLMGDGFPEAQVTIERLGDAIAVDVRAGAKVALTGPQVTGLSADESETLRSRTGTPVVLAEMIRDHELAGRLVEEILNREGFPEARLEEIWVSDAGDGSRAVNLRVDPGVRLTLADVRFTGEDPLGLLADELDGIVAGMPLDRQAIGRATARVRSGYRAAGYADVEVSTSYEEVGDGEMALLLDLVPGGLRSVRRVEVMGLRHIREAVIRNGLTIEPGEVLLPVEVDTSALQTATFAPVDQANVEIREVGLNAADIFLEVTEKPRWTVEAGAGWSTERGTNLQFGLRDDGLLGRGAGLNLRGRWDERQLQFALYASLPPLPRGRWSTVANFFWYDGDSPSAPDDFLQRQLGGAIESTYTLSETTSVRGYLRRQRTFTEVKNPDDFPPGFAPDPTTDDETIVGSQLVWDGLDNPFDPRRGGYAALDVSHNAPWLSSDLNDLRAVLTGSLATEPIEGWTWRQTLRLGALEPLGGTVSFRDRRFFAGGQATVRGFDLNSIGPVIPSLDGFEAAGGDALLVLNEEMLIPVGSRIRAAVFADVGQVWDTWADADWEFSVGAGFGLRLATPVGPLWADVAWPVANRNISSAGAKYYFGLGTTF